jgi:uncharacterized protein YraI
MESLAYLHTALAYESNEPAPALRDLSELLPSPTSAAWLSAQVLAAALVVSAAGSAMAATGIVQTNGNPLNVRSTPGGAIVSSLPNGARVELTGRRSGNYLELANGTWVSADWVAVSSTSPSQPPSGTDRRVGFVSTAGGPLNVRNSPGGAVVGTLPDGTRVELTGRSSNGFLERTNSTWVDARYISYSQPPVTTPAPSPAPNPGTGAGSSTGFVRTNGSPLNVRNAPGGAVVGSIANGSRVELTGRRSGQWVERTNGTWISSNWITTNLGTTPQPQPPTPQPPIGAERGTKFVATNGSPLNIRNAPGGAIIGAIANGSRVELTGRRSGQWVERTDGTWVSNNWLVNDPSGSVGGDISFGRVRTNGSPLNVRNSPGGQVVGTLPNGSRVALTGRRSGSWVQLERFGAWVSSEWIVME